MNLPGPNQTGGADRRRRSLPSERLMTERLAATRVIRHKMAAGIQLDPVDRQTGYLDGLQDRWRLTVDDLRSGQRGRIDALAYMDGWLAGKRFRKNPIGG